MTELDIFKSIKKYSKLSLVFSILIIVFILIVVPLILIGTYSSWSQENSGSSESLLATTPLVSVIIPIFCWVLVIVFAILIIIFNILSIAKSSSLVKSSDKNLCIVMSILSIFLLGIISNIVLIVVSNRNIKQLSLEEQTIIEEPVKPIGPSVY